MQQVQGDLELIRGGRLAERLRIRLQMQDGTGDVLGNTIVQLEGGKPTIVLLRFEKV